MTDAKEPPLSSPALPLLRQLGAQLARWPPFAQMPREELEWFLAHAEQQYYAPGDVLVDPAAGVPPFLFLVRQGTVQRRHGSPETGDSLAFGPGELLPVAALLAQRPVRARYSALDDVFVLALGAADMEQLAQRSVVFAEFLRDRIQSLLARSRQALALQLSSQALAEQASETPLSQLARGEPVHCSPQTSLREVLRILQERHLGSMLVTDAQGRLQGIFTRHDLPRLVLAPDFDLDAPVGRVMSQPVHALDEQDTAQDAALLMGEHGIRHVPITRGGRLAGVVSERDLFAWQRTSVQQVGARIHAARELDTLLPVAADIRALARNLMAQGVQPRPLTELISRLNDLFTRRLLGLGAARDGIELGRLCWLALGSEGRGEQTIASDQDNALVLPDGLDEAEQARIRRWARRMNEALDAAGYPLCRGGIMAGEPACCLLVSQWLARFERWIDHGSPEDLLAASIFFDLRPLAGDASLAEPLRQRIEQRVRATPRFLHLLATNALAHRPPLDWTGRLELDEGSGLDLKLQGTALFVDAARILALSQGVRATGTHDRLAEAGQAMQLRASEWQSWAGAFDYLQGLRLRVQLEAADGGQNPNRLQAPSLSEIDRRILVASLAQARSLQERLRLDWVR
ncbi:DUF294 nucleotidyltransferase-like domain-containing protein [Ramlibacter rhizophilus]|uniref:CBS domain-containing protein n=1 Tax=Ramlibacter rhizophilus TaxID=1781167 RepID=A0A4Z0BL46_9BURK|nr:DUF294 nucleotidyltransferase-like domain-containing protein [Ramlibacter rhizophilus]TFY99510.1 CBS domain-containing protein [Ramlibacter rhizophilus]